MDSTVSVRFWDYPVVVVGSVPPGKANCGLCVRAIDKTCPFRSFEARGGREELELHDCSSFRPISGAALRKRAEKANPVEQVALF